MKGFRLSLGALGAAAVLALPGCFSNNRHQGPKLYAQACAGCHGDAGQGLGRLIPPLAGADYLRTHRDELPCMLRRGVHGPMTVNGILYNQVMPAARVDDRELSPARLTNLLNYIENNWGNHAPPRTIQEVERQLVGCPTVPGAGSSN